MSKLTELSPDNMLAMLKLTQVIADKRKTEFPDWTDNQLGTLIAYFSMGFTAAELLHKLDIAGENAPREKLNFASQVVSENKRLTEQRDHLARRVAELELAAFSRKSPVTSDVCQHEEKYIRRRESLNDLLMHCSCAKCGFQWKESI